MPERPGRPPRSDYMKLSEAAAMLEVSVRTVERMMDRGQLGFRRTPGGQRKLYRSDVEEYCRVTVDKSDMRA